jgi:dihydrofolate synthase/folylpolyglutamate synthase
LKSLIEWEKLLESSSPSSEVLLGLDRVREVWSRLDQGLPRTVLMVAGTNGKGSVVYVAGVLAKEKGLKVGEYTSPHLWHLGERFRINGESVPDNLLTSSFEAVYSAQKDIFLTYFEFLTLACFVLFQRASVELWILEIGLGGRLDAVNALDPDVSVITSIGLDHQEYLGSTVEEIALEKAGVMRPGIETWTAASQVESVLKERAESTGARLSLLSGALDDQDQLSIAAGRVSLVDLKLPRDSVGLAVKALETIKSLPKNGLEEILPTLALPGRMTRCTAHGVEWIVDVGHNADACQFVITTLKAKRCAGPRIVIFGLLADKDAKPIMQLLHQFSDRVVLVGIDGNRGRSVDELACLWTTTTEQTPWRTFATLSDALGGISCDLEPGSQVLVFGSFLLAADALKHEVLN